MNALLNWLDNRTGYRELLHEALYEKIPGGARWRYVFGSMLVFAFVTQAITGVFLWMYYSAGSQNAWESVYTIQTEVQGGWLLRGIHHYMAQAMVALLPLHLLQVVLAGAYRPPREVNYWLGLVLMLLVLAIGLTGYLLPWDQKGYWATKVATELMSLPPGGHVIQELAVGGDEYGHYTLTRFFALHAGVLPGLLVVTLALHLALFRKHGVTAPASSRRPAEDFWPRQVFMDAAACAVLMAAVVAIVCWRGVELWAPAEATETYGAARPEWYFLFLFQLLKKFSSEFVGAIVVPTAVMVFLFLMPITGRVKFGHFVNVVVVCLLLGGAGYLTYEAWDHDNYATRHPEPPAGADADALALHASRTEASQKFQQERAMGQAAYERVRELIGFYGMPREGALALQRQDPETQGPRLFSRHCASCHNYLNEQGEGIRAATVSAPNLHGIGSEAWYRRLLSADPEHGFASDSMFGKTALREGDMADFVQDNLAELSGDAPSDLEALIALLVSEAQLITHRKLDAKAAADGRLAKGRAVFSQNFATAACSDCHKLGDLGEGGSAPDLTGAYSATWLRDIIANPSDARFYGDRNDRMPAFAEHPEFPERNRLTSQEIDLLVRWLRGDDHNLQLKAEVGAAEAAAEAAAARAAMGVPPAPQAPAGQQ